jgi:hypothetical protein
MGLHRIAPIAAVLAAMIPFLAHADSAADLLYARTLMSRADARCRLFTPDIAAALAAAGTQARGATLRSGVNAEGVRQIEDRAALKAYATPCNSPDLKIAADRVRKAFDGYAQLRGMSFPGTASSWQADRHPWPLVVGGKVRPGPRWRLSQATQDSGGRFVFGMSDGPGLVAVSTAGDAAQASAARLVLRDPAKAPDAFIDPRRNDLAGRAPPRGLTQVFLASSIGPAPQSLLPPGAKAGVAVTFPPQAAQAMAALDPREAAAFELVFQTRTGERTETNLIEVGDFAAGRAFLAAGR